MAEGARDRFKMTPEEAREMMRRQQPEERPGEMDKAEIDESYLGDVASRLFDLQAERARLEGDGASAAELLKIDSEIAPLQAFVDEHTADYARMEMPREITKTVRVPEKLREKPSGLKTQRKDLQKRYDLTAAQLESETDPEARAALENGINSLRERIQALNEDIRWEKEDTLFAKGAIKRETAARIKARETAGADFEAAEVDRALLMDLRESYARTLESGAASKAGETLLRGAVQTVEDALDRYGRGDFTVGDFQNRVKDILKARKMWDRYVADEAIAEVRKENFELADTAAAEFRARLEERKQARAEIDAMIAAGIAQSDARRTSGEKAQSAAEWRQWMEAQKAKLGKTPKETDAALAELRAMPEPPSEEERAANRQAANELVGAMEAGPDTTIRDDSAPPPENLPVAEEVEELRGASEADYQAKLATFETLTGSSRTKMLADVEAMARGAGVADDRYTRMREANYPGWLDPDFEQLADRLRRRQETLGAQRQFVKDIDTLTRGSIDRTNAKIDALQEKLRAEQERLRVERNELKPGVEEAWMAQGEQPETLARRERAQELYPDMDVEQADSTLSKIEAKSARDFENETSFIAAFLDAVEKDPAHRINPGAAAEYAKQYWDLLMKENARLAAAMEPPPKVGFWKRLFSGAPKAKETMSAEELVQFQRMDKQVRDILESPETSMRSIRTGGPSRSTPPMGGPLGRPR